MCLFVKFEAFRSQFLWLLPENQDFLLRMHRRATAKFPMIKPVVDAHNVYLIWLSYAEVLAAAGEVNKSRNTFSLIYEQGIASKEASFYLAFAAFEKNNNNTLKAKEIVELGRRRNAQPTKLLRKAAEEIVNGTLEPFQSPSQLSKPKQISTKRATDEDRQGQDEPSERAIVSGPGISPKRRKIASTVHQHSRNQWGSSEIQGLASITSDGDITGGSTKVPVDLIQTSATKSTQAKGSNSHSAFDSSNSHLILNASVDNLQPTPTQIRCESPIPRTFELEGNLPPPNNARKVANGLQSSGKSTLKTGASVHKRPPLLSKTPRLTKMGLTGKAERVGTDNSTIAVDSESDDSLTEFRTNIDPKKFNYILKWSPTRPLSNHEKTSGEEPSSAAKPSPSNFDGGQRCNHANTGRSPSAEALADTSHQSTKLPITPSAATNAEFLPLVEESNMIRINNTPYAKLGVIGKGGSCKVYRALSKDLAVVAIKKVKLKGMDQKAIDGYANEIALLKRLKNNPAIIQMHDSEVDLARRAIYVVMEVGEADLNQILQQGNVVEAEPNSCGKRLDMNFIRLTWQQMLIAVHSIHEARIIHGDLKPANFLFVRGRLKLIDFGIAKAIQSEDTTNIYRESQIGTLNYMSPEAILDSGGGQPGAPKMKCGRVRRLSVLRKLTLFLVSAH